MNIKMEMAKIITLFILGILNAFLFIVSVAVLILLQFHQPVGGSLRPSIWMCVCILLTIVGMYLTLRGLNKLNKESK
jgi:hypothetical protein